ncbi:MAG TPA: MDR family MFS transporter [Symbiobacteriaceae bacterium]|nr:MDR family MFS transporter [Symbiobacteriaceae bacterium]
MSNGRKVLVTIAMLTGLLIAALDQTIVDTAFPKMIAELGGVSMFTWVITAYLLASTAIVPMVGKLSDIYGRKLFWMLGIAIFVGGSVLCGQSQSMTQLIIFRGIQGIGGGMIMPVVQTIIGDMYSGERRARMQGLFTGVMALGSMVGPLVGGWIVDHFHWKYIFLINIPTGALALLLSAWSLKELPVTRGRRVDWLGSSLSFMTIATFLLALQGGGDQWAWGAWQSLALFGTSAVSLVLFVITELRVAEPILDLKLFANRTFAVISLIAFVVGAGMFGGIVFFPWFIQGVVGASATSSGTVLLPMTIMMMIGALLGGRIARRLEYRWQVGVGLAIVSAGFLAATRFSAATTLWEARAAIMLLGFGMGLVQPIITVAMQQAFGRDRRGTVTAAATFFRSVGSAVGVTLFGLLFNSQMSRQFDLLLAPKLRALPQAVTAGFSALAEKPSDLVQVLLQPHLQERIPGTVADTIRTMMTLSIHPVFWAAAILVACGAAAAQLLGRESLATQAKRLQELDQSSSTTVPELPSTRTR